MSPEVWSAARARRFLVAHHHLHRPFEARGAEGARALLQRLRCVQLDPLAPIAPNADLVAMARVDGLRPGDLHDAVLPGHAFEHFAKERCLIPADCFPHYRERLVATPWWRLSARLERLSEALIAEVLAELRERGPSSADELSPRGAVEPLDWNGWKGTAKANTMALEVLATRCEVVVVSRRGPKRYDLPERALPQVARAPAQGDFALWALGERVRAAGLLALADSPSWSMLQGFDRRALAEAAVARGLARPVVVEGSRRALLAPPDDPPEVEPDERLRVLGPLDPLLWDRALVRQVFGFEYVWEVYKPAHQRRWGWYVHPLLRRGRLVGRLEAHREGGRVVVDRLWREHEDLDDDALEEALARL